MKIITNIKDYYDYVSGIYGIDPLVTLDRRNAYFLKDDEESPFSSIVTSDTPTKEELLNRYRFRFYKGGPNFSYIVVGIGFMDYQFEYLRYKDEEGKIVFEVNDIIKFKRNVLVHTNPIAFRKGRNGYYRDHQGNIGCYTSPWAERARFGFTGEQNKLVDDGNAPIPILAGTIIPAYIPAEEMWQNIYDHLSALKEKPIVDNRPDPLKIKSAGFDTKTSFRNIK